MRTTEKLMVVDVETANSTSDALTYDIGFVVCDRQGNIYAQKSMLVSDIFVQEQDIMNSAYYAEKIPKYKKGIEENLFELVTFYDARQIVKETIEQYNITKVFAYNANFDMTALNTTQRWLTKSAYRYFFPYNTEIHCIWNMACQVLCQKNSYIKYCLENGFVSPKGNIKTSAECVYGFLTNNKDFDESHTGLADVLIETQILAKCYKQHKKMNTNINRSCWRLPQKKAREIALALA